MSVFIKKLAYIANVVFKVDQHKNTKVFLFTNTFQEMKIGLNHDIFI